MRHLHRILQISMKSQQVLAKPGLFTQVTICALVVSEGPADPSSSKDSVQLITFSVLFIPETTQNSIIIQSCQLHLDV